MGESLETISLGIFSKVLDDLENGIRRLTNAGINYFAVIADHGFLYMVSREETDKVSQPKGNVVHKSKRFTIGRNLSAGSYPIIPSDYLGIKGEFQIAFPRGIASFKHPGGEEYVHGGLSIQEILIPCLVLESHNKSDTRTLEIDVDYPDKITNLSFEITIKPVGQLFLVEAGREVESLVTCGEVAISEPIKKMVINEPVRFIVRLNTRQLSSKPTTVLISVRDASTKEVLQSRQIPIDIVYDELGI